MKWCATVPEHLTLKFHSRLSSQYKSFLYSNKGHPAVFLTPQTTQILLKGLRLYVNSLTPRGVFKEREMTNVQSMQNLPNCSPVHPSHQNQKDSDKGSWWAIQKQRTCLQILEALWSVSMSGCLWPTVSRTSLVSSESSAGRLWELSLGCKDKERRVNYCGIMYSA